MNHANVSIQVTTVTRISPWAADAQSCEGGKIRSPRMEREYWNMRYLTALYSIPSPTTWGVTFVGIPVLLLKDPYKQGMDYHDDAADG